MKNLVTLLLLVGSFASAQQYTVSGTSENMLIDIDGTSYKIENPAEVFQGANFIGGFPYIVGLVPATGNHTLELENGIPHISSLDASVPLKAKLLWVSQANRTHQILTGLDSSKSYSIDYRGYDENGVAGDWGDELNLFSSNTNILQYFNGDGRYANVVRGTLPTPLPGQRWDFRIQETDRFGLPGIRLQMGVSR